MTQWLLSYYLAKDILVSIAEHWIVSVFFFATVVWKSFCAVYHLFYMEESDQPVRFSGSARKQSPRQEQQQQQQQQESSKWTVTPSKCFVPAVNSLYDIYDKANNGWLWLWCWSTDCGQLLCD